MTRGERLLIGLNYHRIGDVDARNPFHRLHTVSRRAFEQQIELALSLGEVVSPDQLDDPHELPPLGFLVSFDDVPLDALAGIELLRTHGLPYVASVCTELADSGCGHRDRVYAVLSELDEVEIYARVAADLGHLLPPPAEFSFYRFSKSAVLPHAAMLDQVIDPLYDLACRRRGHGAPGRGYLDWPSVRALVADPLATIVNHSRSHANFAALSAAEVHGDISASHRRLAQQLEQAPRYFAVPFGAIEQRVCVDVARAAHDHGYVGVFWVGLAANVIARRGALHQVVRLHAPSTAAAMRRIIGTLHRRRFVVESIPRSHHHDRVEVRAGDELAEVVGFELLARQDKPYAADRRFFRYAFLDNPSRGERPAFSAVMRAGRPEAVLYNFHATFRLAGVRVPGMYIANWRRLPIAHRLASGMLLRAAMRDEAVVGVQSPSNRVANAFAEWRAVDVHHITIQPASITPERLTSVEITPPFPDELADLCEQTATAAAFTLDRSPRFYRWRYGRYPLAHCEVLVLSNGGRPVAASLILQAASAWSISDYLVEELDDRLTERLIRAVCTLASRRGVPAVEVRTSSKSLCERLRRIGATTASTRRSYYHFSYERLSALGIDPDRLDRPRSAPYHETEACGDVLHRDFSTTTATYGANLPCVGAAPRP